MDGSPSACSLKWSPSCLWDLKENGRTGGEIAVLLGWKKTAVFDHLEEHGGIRPRWGRNLTGRSLSFEERQEIMIYSAKHLSVREIGRRLGRSHSTISRELRRNVLPRNRYRATTAHRIAFDAARPPRPGKLASPGLLRDQMKAGLKGKLSPEQISGRLRVDYPTQLSMRVSHYLGAKYRRIKSRRGPMKALVAVEHSTLIASWHMLTNNDLYTDPGPDYFVKRRPTQTQARAIHQLESLGYTVTMEPLKMAG